MNSESVQGQVTPLPENEKSNYQTLASITKEIEASEQDSLRKTTERETNVLDIQTRGADVIVPLSDDAQSKALSKHGIQTQHLKKGSRESQKSLTKIEARPTLKDLVIELDSILDWQLLMLNLGVEKHAIDKIERNFPNDLDRQKQEAFDRWLRQKHNACWKDIIDALFEMKENTLARKLSKKYNWKDPRVYVNRQYVSAPAYAGLTAQLVPKDLPCRKSLPPLEGTQQFYTLETKFVQQMNERLAQGITKHFTRLINTKYSEGHTMLEFLKSIEESDSKNDFRVGFEARFGKVYWKLDQESVLPANSTRDELFQSKVLRKHAFNPEVEETDADQLFKDKERLGKEIVTRITLNYIVEGQDGGNYSAVIANYESDSTFHLGAVYRESAIENKARISFALPGRKYDMRIALRSECILLEPENSIPHKIAKTIVESFCRLPGQKLHLIVRGETKKSSWKVQHIRQRVQRQYKWKPERRWILARYDIDVFARDTNETLIVDSSPLNEGVNIPEFDYSRKEVELWGQHIYPKDVNKTHPSSEEYYYFEGVEGVKLPGGEIRKPYNWTAEGLMRDFEEFLGDAFKIAYILDGAMY